MDLPTNQRNGNTETVSTMNEIKKPTDLGFSLWSHNLGYASGVAAVVTGVFAILYHYQCANCDNRPEAAHFLWSEIWAGIVVLALGAISIVFEYFYGLRQCTWLFGESETQRSYLRPLLYFVLCVFACFTVPTLLVAIIFLICAIVNLLSILYHEYFEKPRGSETYCLCTMRFGSVQDDHKSEDPEMEDDPASSFCEKLKRSWHRMRETGVIGEIILAVLYTCANIGIFSAYVVTWYQRVNAQVCDPSQQYNCLNVITPLAKGCGGTLNFNCTFILLPVLKSMMQTLNDVYQKKFTHSISEFLPPLRKNIVFHKFVALFLFLGTVGHVVFHLVGVMLSPEGVLKVFGWSPIVSGVFILIAFVCIFTGAQKRIRQARYEIFWGSHHFYAIFYLFLLCHAPQFWIWGGWVLILFVVEKFYRKYQHNKPFYLSRVVYENPVLRLHMYPAHGNQFKFLEGQYVYLCIPSVNPDKWHPFTLSSASENLEKLQDPYFTLHIKVLDEGSWTHSVMEFFRGMTKEEFRQGDDFSVALSHEDSRGAAVLGQHLGSNGKPLIRVDGPHAAPVQHYANYDHVMLIGAGIGLTPSAAILESVLKFKWTKNFGPKTLVFCWVVRHSEIKSFRWFIEILIQLQTRLSHNISVGTIDPKTFRFEAHIFITSAPEVGPARRVTSLRLDPGDIDVESIGIPMSDIAMEPLVFSRVDLENAMLCPVVRSSRFGEHQNINKNVFGNIRVWGGRPNWDGVFERTKAWVINANMEVAAGSSNLHERVGVCFCGSVQIGKDLNSQCIKASSVRQGVVFSYHKENF